MARRLVSVTLIAGGLAVAASQDLPGGSQTLALWVAPYRTECTGFSESCLLVSSDPAEAWEYLFDGIEGFAFEPGYTWKLKVRRFRVADPVAEGVSHRLVLIEVLEKRKA